MLSNIHIVLFGAAFIGHTTRARVVSSKSSSYTYCYNYTECEDDTIDTNYAACMGYYGCDSADISSSYTLAYGELGCYDADVDSKYTYGYGHYGAYAASISSEKLYGYGYKAARIADIEPYSNELHVYFYGYYGGESSDVSCYSGDYCYLYCGSGHGCYGVDFYCYSGATCYYDCSGDDVCPTSYSGVDSDLTYVTSAGYGSATANDDSDASNMRIDNSNSEKQRKHSKINNDAAIIYTGLTDDEIAEIKQSNQEAKDKSKTKLQQDTLDDTNTQLRMTFEQEFWLTGARAQQAEQEREEENAREEEQNEEANVNNNNDNKKNKNENENEYQEVKEPQYADVKSFTNYKNNNNNNNRLLFGISLNEYGVALIIDICIIAIVAQTYNYCIKAKAYQSI